MALALLAGNATYAERASAALLEIPVALDYRIVEQALGEQLFTGPGGTAEIYADPRRCNTLVLSEPRVEGTDNGHLRLRTSLHAQAGTPLFGRCWFAKSWRGLVETVQTAHVASGSSTVSFRVEDSALLNADDQQEVLPRFVQGWVRDYVHPRLGAVTLELQPAVSGLQELLDTLVTEAPLPSATTPPVLLSPLRLTGVRPGSESLAVVLSVDVADAPADPLADTPPTAEVPLSEEELAEWDAAWQEWDGFATWLIKTLALQARPALTEALVDTLLDARYDLRDALASDDRDRDPVRELFLKTWERLAPLVQDLQPDLPGGQAMRYATFVGAGDALRSLDLLAPHLGLRFDRNTLRSMARMLVPAVSDYDLRYDTAVDPDLRMLFGLDPEFQVDTELGEDEEPGAAAAFLDWLIGSAHAAQIRAELIKQLNGWVPRRREIDDYLLTVEELLNAVAEAERGRGKVPPARLDLYDALLRATAWQESCWRQYVVRDGAVETIRSAAGSVGLMQVNVHVWRGLYDFDALHRDVAYNARAGSEILVHYLVDYALKRLERGLLDDPDNIARATYAVYNGGPRHLTRFRNPKTSTSLKEIDNAFWQKYRAIQTEGPMAVKSCLAG